MSRPKKNAWLCPHTDKPNFAHGRCESCYGRHRYLQAHPNCQARTVSRLARFIKRVVVAPNGCWLWTGAAKSASQGSYPMMHVGKGESPQHAVAWAYEHIRGLKRPRKGDGVELSHTCPTLSRCCNPYHVVCESRADNIARIPKDVLARATATARAARRASMKALCHPDRKHFARHLCCECYTSNPRAAINKQQRERYATDPAYRARVLKTQADARKAKQEKLCPKLRATLQSVPVMAGNGLVKVT